MKLVIDKELTYYPSDAQYKHIQNVLVYLMQHPDGALQSYLCNTFHLPVLWLERLDKMGVIRISSKWIGKDPDKVNRAWIYTVKIWNKKKALQIIKKDITVRIVTKETEVVDRINRLLDSKETEVEENEDDEIQ